MSKKSELSRIKEPPAKAGVPALTLVDINRLGRQHDRTIHIEPSSRKDLNFKGALDVVSVERFQLNYVITANLPRNLANCLHCGSDQIASHGRYVVRLSDLPYIDSAGRAIPIQYKISAQRYLCRDCKRGDVEPLPTALRPVLTTARITQRLSEWLIFTIQSSMTYDTIARMTDYSKVWVRKWYQEVRTQMDLPKKPSKPGPKKKVDRLGQ